MGFTNFRPPSPHFTDGNAEAKATKLEAAQHQGATCIKLSLPLQDTLLDWPPSLGSEPLSPSPCHHSTHQFCAEGKLRPGGADTVTCCGAGSRALMGASSLRTEQGWPHTTRCLSFHEKSANTWCWETKGLPGLTAVTAPPESRSYLGLQSTCHLLAQLCQLPGASREGQPSCWASGRGEEGCRGGGRTLSKLTMAFWGGSAGKEGGELGGSVLFRDGTLSLVSPSSVCMRVTCHLSFQASSTPSLSWLDSAPGLHPLTPTVFDYLSPGPSFRSVLCASMSPVPGAEGGVGE